MWVIITRLSNLLATMEANLCSPASSDIKKTYSGAVTWFDLWVLPVNKQPVYDVSSAWNLFSDGYRRNPSGYRSFWCHCINSPNCCMALSALQGSSSVMWTLLLWFFTRRSACKEIPELAASDMMAMFCLRVRYLLKIKQEIYAISTSRKLQLPSLHPWTSASLSNWGFPPGRQVLSGIHRWCFHRHYSPHDLYDQSSTTE